MCKKLTIILMFVPMMLWAQSKTVTGKVTSGSDGQPLPGVTVLVKGTTQGVSTDFDGNYSIEVKENAVLQFSYVGFAAQEVRVGERVKINVVLKEDAQALDEVVVTALGIKREKKSLGYAIQEVKGADLVETREANLANTITGKVAGLQVVRSSNGPASSSKIVLRGNNSLTGDNQPLIVVDGIPINNFTGAVENTYWNPSADMGNGLGDLNPEDIESMSVLKGASAAALYGSRAGNGVILITTKKGLAKKGLGISYSSNVSIETIFMKPDLQDSFGQGSNGLFDGNSTSSWGPKIKGQEVTNWWEQKEKLSSYDNLSNYYKPGHSVSHNVAFQQQLGGKTSLYTSFSHLDNDSKIPGALLNKTNISTRANSKFGSEDEWSSDIKVQYINIKAENRPLSGVNNRNSFSTLYLMPRSLDITRFKKSTDNDGNMIWYVPGSVNPYWASKYNLNQDSRDRFLLNGSVSREITDWLSAEIKAGADLYTTNTEAKLYAGSPLGVTGKFSVGKNTFIETNYSALLRASQDNLIGKLGVAATLGANLMHQKSSSIRSWSGELEVPNLFSLTNGKDKPGVREGYSERKMNSVYGTLQLNYNGYFFVDVTGRNDWSSTLSKENRSFFYPSVSSSLVISDMINKMDGNLPSWLTYAKLRGSMAQVGNDLNPYKLYNSYSIGKSPLGSTTASSDGTQYNANVKSELITSYEVGLEMKFLSNRLGLDVAWYKSNATNQLLDLPINPYSGYKSKLINAGNIQNQGVELSLNARLFDNPEGFSWNTIFNYSANKNTIEDLIPGEEESQYTIGGFDHLSVLAVNKGMYGEIWGTKYKRVEDAKSPHYGKLILNDKGVPIATDKKYNLGSQQPDALLGLINTFAYKNISMSISLDARIGGKIFSGTNRFLKLSGASALTVVDGKRDKFIVSGVTTDGDGNYVENKSEVTPQDYWRGVSTQGNLGINEENIFDATSIRVRNIAVQYKLPSNWLAGTFIEGAKLGVSCNNVWMIKSHLNGIDPESVYATGTNAVGFENLTAPTSRTYNFNVSINF